MWWNDRVKAAVNKKEVGWKKLLGVSDENAKERCMEAYKEEKRNVEKCIYQRKKEVNKQFGRKMNQGVNGNKKLFWKGVSKVNGKKLESWSRIKDGKGRLALGEVKVQRIWKEYFEGLYNTYS